MRGPALNGTLPICQLLAWLSILVLSPMLGADQQDVATTLQRYAGTWDTTIEWSNPDIAEPIKWDGHSTTDLIGSNWTASRHLGNYLGMAYDASESMGFDQKKNTWTSIWVDRMQDYIQVMEGTRIDADSLEFTGKVFDDDSQQWLAVTRTDHWLSDDKYTSSFVKKNPADEVVETLTVTHVKRSGDS